MYKDYEKCSDEELIMRQRDGEEAVTDYIMDKYKNLVKAAPHFPCQSQVLRGFVRISKSDC